ncbi:HNH endonuclease [Archangium gephyra]|uniref:HNH endonuclease n=1 Tax=Archangium gephyra TaxID=48 RepID=UPI003B77979F
MLLAMTGPDTVVSELADRLELERTTTHHLRSGGSMSVAAVARAVPLFLLLVLGALGSKAAHAEDSWRSQPAPLLQERLSEEESAAPADHAPGVASKNRKGLPFTRTGKKIVKKDNADRNQGQTRCENCDIETVPAEQHKTGVTPPVNETHVDHVIPRVEGGRGDPDNGQVLCRDCNLKKGAKVPEAPRKSRSP